MAALSPIVRRSTEDQALDALRDHILTGAAPPGSRLTELGLSEALAISRATVRTSLHRLAAEALVLHPAALADVNRDRLAAGLPRVRSLLDHLHGVADLSLGLFPEWFGPARPDWPQPFCGAGFPLHDPLPPAPLPASHPIL